MTTPLPDTALVFTDLTDSKEALDAARGSPKEVRRCFSRYVDLSQRLTSAMRIDYSRTTGEKWQASEFPNWTVETAFLKWLRNEDQHENQIYVSVHERQFYQLEATGDKLLVFEGTWVLVDQMTDAVPNGISFHLPDPVTGGISETTVQPVRVEYQYLFQPRTPKAMDWFKRLGNSDIHRLAGGTYDTLSDYYAFFRQKTDA